MNRRLLRGLSATVALGVGVLGPLAVVGPAPAVGDGDPAITSPAPNASVDEGYTGPVRIDFSHAPALAYEVEVDSNDTSTSWSRIISYDGTQDIYTVTGEPLAPGRYQASVADSETGGAVAWDSLTFTVQAERLVIDDVAVSPKSFHDSTRFSYRLSHRAQVTATVLRDGRTVRSARIGEQSRGRHGWTWSGRNDAGEQVRPGSYTIKITGTTDTRGTKTVQRRVEFVPRPLVIDRVSVSPETFYPRVRDGFRDTTRIRYRLSERAKVVATVVNRDGRIVRRAKLGYQAGHAGWATGRHHWRWNGRNKAGAKVAVGRYFVEITGRTVQGATRSVRRSVKVTTDVVTRRDSVIKAGVSTSSTDKTNDCYVERYLRPELQLDCWGGAYAEATYLFKIPRNAFDVRWGVSGYQGCCDEGTITKTATRVKPHLVRVHVKVTNWRQYTVRRVGVFYKHEVRR
jgi:flagellar hook assembly protein FlgD